ncbi:Neprilysin-4, partial [Schistosoma japonicum]
DINGSSSPNPCVDFYEYACSDWKSQNPLSNGIDSITTVTQAQQKVNMYIWKLITDDSYSSNDLRLQAANKFYKSCTDYRSSDTFISACRQWIYMYFGQWGLMPSTQQIDGAPNIENMDLTDFCLPAIMQFGYSLLFSIDIDPRARSINISPGSLWFDLTTDKTQCKKDKEKFSNAASNLGILESHKTEIEAAFQMRKNLSRKNEDPKSSQSQEFKKNTTLKELNSICPEIRWRSVFAKVFKEAEYEDYEGLPITIEREEQLKQRCKQHASALQTDRNEVKEAFEQTLTKHYLHLNVNETHKKEVTTMFEELKKTVLKSIPEYNWLTVDQKEFVSKKIEKMKIHALYTSVSDLEKKENNSAIHRYTMEKFNYYWNKIHAIRARYLDRIRNYLSPSDVSLSPLPAFMPSAYYQRQENRIYVSAEFLQPPLYTDGGDISSKFGSLGFVLGHEVLHSISVIGIRWDENGNILNSEFSTALSNKIIAKTDCLQEQYGKDESTRHKVKKSDSLDEIVADSGAITMSFKTYKRLSAKLAGHGSQDPDATHKHDQSLFHHFAQFFCGNERGKAVENYIKHTPYVLVKNRVNLALSNSVEFTVAYQCPIGSSMNPPKRCKVY